MTTTVGELARRTGLTTRTLHHYEALGLLRPAQRSPAGYRLYDEASVARLHAVLAYRYLGLPLKEIAALLADDPPPLRELLRRQASLVEERIAQHERLHELGHLGLQRPHVVVIQRGARPGDQAVLVGRQRFLAKPRRGDDAQQLLVEFRGAGRQRVRAAAQRLEQALVLRDPFLHERRLAP